MDHGFFSHFIAQISVPANGPYFSVRGSLIGHIAQSPKCNFSWAHLMVQWILQRFYGPSPKEPSLLRLGKRILSRAHQSQRLGGGSSAARRPPPISAGQPMLPSRRPRPCTSLRAAITPAHQAAATSRISWIQASCGK